MKNIINVYIVAAVVALVVIVAVVSRPSGRSQEFSGNGLSQPACTVSTVARASVGHQLSSTILSANSRRAYAAVQLVSDGFGVATNTVSVALDAGTAATLSTGISLSTSTPTIVFGLNTENPYTGAVTGITSTGSTTVRVTQCVY